MTAVSGLKSRNTNARGAASAMRALIAEQTAVSGLKSRNTNLLGLALPVDDVCGQPLAAEGGTPPERTVSRPGRHFLCCAGRLPQALGEVGGHASAESDRLRTEFL